MVRKAITDKKTSWDKAPSTVEPLILLEELEPRILLSADGLHAIAPDPLVEIMP